MREEHIQKIKETFEELRRLTNEQVIMLALSELITSGVGMPPGIRIPLAGVLMERSQWRST